MSNTFRWTCSRCGTHLEIPSAGHECVVVVQEKER